MDNLINMLIGDLSIAPEYIFIARLVVLILCVEVVTSLLSAINPIAKLTR